MELPLGLREGVFLKVKAKYLISNTNHIFDILFELHFIRLKLERSNNDRANQMGNSWYWTDM